MSGDAKNFSSKKKKNAAGDEADKDFDPNSETVSAKTARKRKLKPHAVQYLQPPKNTKREEGSIEAEQSEKGKTSIKNDNSAKSSSSVSKKEVSW